MLAFAQREDTDLDVAHFYKGMATGRVLASQNQPCYSLYIYYVPVQTRLFFSTNKPCYVRYSVSEGSYYVVYLVYSWCDGREKATRTVARRRCRLSGWDLQHRTIRVYIARMCVTRCSMAVLVLTAVALQ